MVPMDPTSQLRAVGGFRTLKLLALQFQTTMWAPAQPWPVPELPRFRTLIWLPLMVTRSNNPPTDQR